jgi:hypothetical protein
MRANVEYIGSYLHEPYSHEPSSSGVYFPWYVPRVMFIIRLTICSEGTEDWGHVEGMKPYDASRRVQMG